MILSPLQSIPIVYPDRRMAESFRLWTVDISAYVTPLMGVGSPEGVVSAPQGREYMDTAGIAGAIKYIKRDAHVGGDKTLGWILI